MPLPRRLGRDSVIDIVQTLRGTFAVKARGIGVVGLLDTMDWSVARNYRGSTVGLQSSSRFYKSPTDGAVDTALPHVIVVTVDGSTWYPSYTNNDVVMASVTAYALGGIRIGIDTPVYTPNSGGGAGDLFKVRDIGEPFEPVSQGVWDTSIWPRSVVKPIGAYSAVLALRSVSKGHWTVMKWSPVRRCLRCISTSPWQ